MSDADYKELNARFAERLGMSRREMERDRKGAEAFAEEAFPEGSLGRLSTDQPADIEQFAQTRRDMVQDAQRQGQVDFDLRMRDIAGMNKEYADLIKERTDPRSRFNQAMRDRANQAISGELRGQLRNIGGMANAGGFAGGLQQGMINDAIGMAAYNRAQVETDIALGSQEAAEGLAGQRSAMQSERLGAMAAENRAREQSISQLQRSLEEVRAGTRQDTLARELINLQNAAQERYGRLSTQEALVNQGIAERTGVRQGLLSESQLAAQDKYQQQQLEIQRIEAQKEPPKASGGKSVLCIAYWKTGDISAEVLEGDFAYAEANIDDDTRRGYFAWSLPIVRRIGTRGFTYRFFRPFVVAWANEMASRMGVASAKSNLLGKMLCAIGVTPCRYFGRVVAWWTGDDTVVPTTAQTHLEMAYREVADKEFIA